MKLMFICEVNFKRFDLTIVIQINSKFILNSLFIKSL